MLGVLLVVGGLLLLTGASLGAALQRSGTAVRQASAAVRARERRSPPPVTNPVPEPEPESLHAHEPLVDAVADYPDLVAAASPAAFPGPDDSLFDHGFDEDDTQQTLFEVTTPEREYVLPDRALLKRSKAGAGPSADTTGRVASALVQCLANFGVAATVIGEISGPARDTVRAPARARDQGGQGRAAEGRSLVRPRDDGDQDPRPDPRQAGGRGRGTEPLTEPRHARGYLRRPSRRRQARFRSGSARTSPALPSGPTSRACRTS